MTTEVQTLLSVVPVIVPEGITHIQPLCTIKSGQLVQHSETLLADRRAGS